MHGNIKQMKDSGTIYLICFNRPYEHAKHCLGVAIDLDKRITDQLWGMGARLMEVVAQEPGIIGIG